MIPELPRPRAGDGRTPQSATSANGDSSVGENANRLSASRGSELLGSPTGIEQDADDRNAILPIPPDWQPDPSAFETNIPAQAVANGFENMYMFGQDVLYPLDPFDVRLNPYSGPAQDYQVNYPPG